MPRRGDGFWSVKGKDGYAKVFDQNVCDVVERFVYSDLKCDFGEEEGLKLSDKKDIAQSFVNHLRNAPLGDICGWFDKKDQLQIARDEVLTAAKLRKFIGFYSPKMIAAIDEKKVCKGKYVLSNARNFNCSMAGDSIIKSEYIFQITLRIDPKNYSLSMRNSYLDCILHQGRFLHEIIFNAEDFLKLIENNFSRKVTFAVACRHFSNIVAENIAQGYLKSLEDENYSSNPALCISKIATSFASCPQQKEFGFI